MFPISPNLKDFPRDVLHAFIKRDGVRFERGVDRIGQGQVQLPSQLFFDLFGHLSGRRLCAGLVPILIILKIEAQLVFGDLCELRGSQWRHQFAPCGDGLLADS